MRFSLWTLVVTCLGTFAALGGCEGCGGSGTPPPIVGSCVTTADCADGESCLDERCRPTVRPDGGADASPDVDAASCPAARTCGEVCCDEGLVCGAGSCCAPDTLCGGACCGTDQRCEADRCVLACGADRAVCGSGAEAVCCAVGDLCYLGACTTPGPVCTSTRSCPDGTYCETTALRCLPRATGTMCEYRPPVGPLELREEWHWSGDAEVFATHAQVMMAPMVANLDDDDGDGRVDANDIPDIVFHTFTGFDYWGNGILRAVRGSDGARLWPDPGMDPGYRTTPGGEVAIAELDAASPGPEIVACSASTRPSTAGHVLLIRADGTLLRAVTSVPCGFDAPAIGDMDNDGVPEIVVRGIVLHADGTVVATLFPSSATAPTGAYITLADVDGDGTLELATSAAVFRLDGTTVWDRRADGALGPAVPEGGQLAIGDLDRDGAPELITVTGGDHAIRALRATTGETVWGPVDINPLDDASVAADVASDTSAGRGGGPPTIANFDADPEPEIAFAGGFAYVIFNADGTRLWYDVTTDRSSRVTGSSVFDFEGDGVAEVAYNDERQFRIYRGPDGSELFTRCNTSGTLREYPIIVDVDNDDHAEVVLMANNYAFGCLDGTASGTGIYVFGHPRNQWVRTRRFWNQHSYHVTNVNEDGTIPRTEARNWTVPGLNNFRQNVQPDGLFDAPDLVVLDLSASTRACPASLALSVRVVNRGAAGAPAGIPVTFYDVTGAMRVRLGRAVTTRPLLPGEGEVLTLSPDFPLPAGMETDTFRFDAILNDPEDMPRDDVNQCDTTNDTAAAIEARCPSLG
jgi:hypothetical protein